MVRKELSDGVDGVFAAGWLSSLMPCCTPWGNPREDQHVEGERR